MMELLLYVDLYALYVLCVKDYIDIWLDLVLHVLDLGGLLANGWWVLNF